MCNFYVLETVTNHDSLQILWVLMTIVFVMSNDNGLWYHVKTIVNNFVSRKLWL